MRVMTVRSAIGTIFGCTLLFAAIGASVGYGLGTFVPGYYRSVFRSAREPWFDPVSVGVGQGVTQGTAGGVVVGVVVVALLCWRDIRLNRVSGPPPAPDGTPHASEAVVPRILLICGVVLALGFGICVGGVLGSVAGAFQAHHHQYVEESNILAPALAAEPTFAEVIICE